jgi:hypothetical protein
MEKKHTLVRATAIVMILGFAVRSPKGHAAGDFSCDYDNGTVCLTGGDDCDNFFFEACPACGMGPSYECYSAKPDCADIVVCSSG